jgi:hypothetical protein
MIVTAVCVGLGAAAQPDSPDPVLKKLNESKTAYEKERAGFREGVLDWFDKQEEAARSAGMKKRLDQIIADRDAYKKSGVYPPDVPAPLLSRYEAARKARDAAFQTAIKEFTKARLDATAKMVEDELREFRYTSTPLGSRLRDKPARLVNTNSGKVAAVADASTKDGATIIQYDSTGGADQQWVLVPTDDDCYLLKNVNSKSYLGRPGKEEARLALVKAADADAKAHHWRVTPVRGTPDAYLVQNRATGKYLGVEGGSRGNAAKVVQVKLNGATGSPDQHWKFEKAGY